MVQPLLAAADEHHCKAQTSPPAPLIQLLARGNPPGAIRGGAIVGFEALLRYNSPQSTLELPDTLAEAFNDYELAAKIGELMQRRVARDIRGWLDADHGIAKRRHR